MNTNNFIATEFISYFFLTPYCIFQGNSTLGEDLLLATDCYWPGWRYCRHLPSGSKSVWDQYDPTLLPSVRKSTAGDWRRWWPLSIDPFLQQPFSGNFCEKDFFSQDFLSESENLCIKTSKTISTRLFLQNNFLRVFSS